MTEDDPLRRMVPDPAAWLWGPTEYPDEHMLTGAVADDWQQEPTGDTVPDLIPDEWTQQ